MAETFEGIEDYTAQIRWKNGDTEYLGTMRYKKGNKFFIEFEVPEDQVIVSNGEYLYIYIPYLKVVIQQSLKETTESTILTGTTEAGLFKLFDEYSFSFHDTSRPQPFESERAYHLKLFQKRPKVGFKTMDLWVSDEGLILQSNGRSPNGFDVSLTFSDIEINTELPDYIFDFEVPADAQIMRNTIVPFSDNL
jgi:outer membrane lipoprotein-sorting protein